MVVSMGVLEPIPPETERQISFGGSQRLCVDFVMCEVGVPNSCVVQGSTVSRNFRNSAEHEEN